MESIADRIVRVLLAEARCSECGGAYRAEDVHILRQLSDRVWDLAVVCSGCYTLSLVRAIVQPQAAAAPEGEAALPLLFTSELSSGERQHFADLDPIEMDELLDLSSFLDGFDGDFRRLFARGRPDS